MILSSSKGFPTLLFTALCHCTSAAKLDSSASHGDLIIKDLFISNPIQADVTANYNSTLDVVVIDEDCQEEQPVHCQINWKAGVGPPTASKYQCQNKTTRIWFPENTFNGVKNFQLQLAHTFVDTAVGPCPQYCFITKYAAVNLTYPNTPQYECDVDNTVCAQRINTTIKAPVFLVVS